jgi:transcriptional regulator with XRE-family HTH domain
LLNHWTSNRSSKKNKKSTQSQVAEKLEIEVETASRLETGTISPTLERFEHFNQLFDYTVGTFFCSDSQEIKVQFMYLAELMPSLKANEKSYLIYYIVDFVNLLY